MSLFLIIFSPYLGYQALLYFHYKAVLPSEIEVSFQFQLLKKGVLERVVALLFSDCQI